MQKTYVVGELTLGGCDLGGSRCGRSWRRGHLSRRLLAPRVASPSRWTDTPTCSVWADTNPIAVRCEHDAAMDFGERRHFFLYHQCRLT